jgi:apolipoprotein N-acyltransferase
MKKKSGGLLQHIQSKKGGDLGLRTAAGALGGALWFLSCADFDVWPLAWVAMIPIFWAMEDKRPRAALYYAWVAGLVANAGGFYWIVGLLMRFARLPYVAAIPLYLLLCAYQAVVFALFGYCVNLVRRRQDVGLLWLAPVIMVALELVVPFVFPWYLAITQAWVVPVIQIADVTGPLGVTFLLIMINAALYEVITAAVRKKRIPWLRASVAFGILAVCLVYGQVRIYQTRARQRKAPKVKIGVVQANIGITLKGRSGFRKRQLQIHQELSRQLEKMGAELLVWPESSYPYYLPRAFEHDQDLPVHARVQQGFKLPIIFGSVTVAWPKGKAQPERVYNTALILDADGKRGELYDKKWLLIFGEYIPFYKELKFMQKWFRRRRMSNFDRGTRSTVYKFQHRGKTYRLAPMICYEDIIPSFGRDLARFKPHMFVNVTNDAWFGDTSEPYEHMALAVYRTVEHRIAMVRSVNTGVSAFIDATGKVIMQSPAVGASREPAASVDPAGAIRSAGVKKVGPGLWRAPVWPKPHLLLGDLPLMDPSFTVYAAVGDVFGYLNLLALLYLVIFFRRNVWRKLFKRKPGTTSMKGPSGASKPSDRRKDSKKKKPRTRAARSPKKSAGTRHKGPRRRGKKTSPKED